MNLTSVKYQDSCIYIALDNAQGTTCDNSFLKKLKSVYAIYKIKAYDNYVRDAILVRKQDLSTVRGEIVIKFELNQLHKPDECEIEIVSLKFIFQSGKREELTVNQSYAFQEIRTRNPVLPPTKKKSAL